MWHKEAVGVDRPVITVMNLNPLLPPPEGCILPGRKAEGKGPAGAFKQTAGVAETPQLSFGIPQLSSKGTIPVLATVFW